MVKLPYEMLTEGNHVKPRSGSQVGANMREENKEYIHYLSMVSSQPCVGPDEQEKGNETRTRMGKETEPPSSRWKNGRYVYKAGKIRCNDFVYFFTFMHI